MAGIDFETLFTKYFWALMIVSSFINVPFLWKRVSKDIAEYPHKKDGYMAIIKGSLIFPNIPWVLLGAGFLTGHVESIMDVLPSAETNPFAIAFLGSWLFLYALAAYWIYASNGAEMIVEYGDMFNMHVKDTKTVKLFFGIMLIAIIPGVVMFFYLS